MSVLKHYKRETLETALIVARAVRANIKLAIFQGDHETLRHGICSEWDDVSEGYNKESMLGRIRDGLYSEWPKFSGSSWYPIPMPELDEDDYQVYVASVEEYDDAMPPAHWIYEQVGNMWDGEYGALRMDCLDWMIATLEAAVL